MGEFGAVVWDSFLHFMGCVAFPFRLIVACVSKLCVRECVGAWVCAPVMPMRCLCILPSRDLAPWLLMPNYMLTWPAPVLSSIALLFRRGVRVLRSQTTDRLRHANDSSPCLPPACILRLRIFDNLSGEPNAPPPGLSR